MSPWQFWRIILLLPTIILFFDQAVGQDEPDSKTETILPPQIYSLHITSDIKYRYAQTSVVSRVANPANVSQEVHFHLVLPESAFITGFVMTIKEKDYKAYVKEKEEAKLEYNAAVNAGLSAAHVAYTARDSNEFTVSVNIEPMEKVTFNLTYEDFLKRTLGSYKHEINISPGQIVKDLKVIVDIEDAFPITDVRVPDLRTNNEIAESEESNKLAEIKRSSPDSKKVQIRWSPLEDEQKNMVTDEQNKMGKQGVQGQFVVYYEVDRSSKQQVLIDDGYFVHFYTADDLMPLNKHVVFVLDVSGSMGGRKLAQLKEAMDKILSDMSSDDFFSIILFSEIAKAWAPDKPFEFSMGFDYVEGKRDDQELSSEYVISASKENIDRAKEFVRNMDDYGGTNIMAGLRNGIKLARIGSSSLRSSPHKPQPIIIFLTDGEPNIEVSDPKAITEKSIEMNTLRVPIFSLAFGSGADINFLRNLSLTNSGFARTIYAASDATLQLKNFFKAVSSPLLQNVTFEYLPGQAEALPKKDFNLLFSGTELVVVGKAVGNTLDGKLRANSREGSIIVDPVPPILIDPIIHPPTEVPVKKEPGHLERLWAYETIKNLLDENTAHANETTKKQALELALKYSFVTPVTSLVVVKPNETKPVDTTASGSSFGSYSVQSQPLLMPGMHFAAPSAGAGSGFSGLPGGGQTDYSYSGLSGPPGPPPPSMLARPMYLTSTHKPYAVPEAAEAPLDTMDREDLPVIPQGDFARSFNISDVTWLTVTEGKDVVEPPSSVGTDVISLFPTDNPKIECIESTTNTTRFCKHFVQCVLPDFLNDPESFMPFKCHIDPNFLGVCCPF